LRFPELPGDLSSVAGNLNAPGEPLSGAILPPETAGITQFLVFAGFSADWIQRLLGLAREAHSAPEFWADWQRELGDFLAKKQTVRIPSKGLEWQVLALAQRMQELAERHGKEDIDLRITKGTVGDLSRWALAIENDTVPGRTLPIHWFRNHLRRDLLEIGCLQFVPVACNAPVHIYRRKDNTLESMALGAGGIPCDSLGWPTKSDAAFITAWEENADAFFGHMVNCKSGAFLPSTTRLAKTVWSPVFKPGDWVLDIHIPEGTKLSTESCRAAFHEAESIFGRWRPALNWQVFYCTTWMLDPALDDLLDTSSRIHEFAAEFHRVTTRHPDGGQIIERVLNKTPDWRSFVPKTSLQRKVCAFLQKGGIFRTTSGYRLKE